MRKGLGTTLVLVIILCSMLVGFFYLQSQNLKENEKVLLKSIHKLNDENSELQLHLNDSNRREKLFNDELKSLQDELLDIQKELQDIQKENNRLKRQLEARKEAQNSIVSVSQKVSEPNTLRVRANQNQGGKVAYLTFDDGPSPNTEKVLDILKEKQIKATFFVIGKNDPYSISLYKRMINEGHVIGNHTYSHDYSYIYKNEDNFFADIDKLNKFIHSNTGFTPNIFRFPGGSNNRVSWKYSDENLTKRLASSLQSRGLPYFDWNVDSTDASVALQSKDIIVSKVLKGVNGKKDPIILMHDTKVKTTTAEALPSIVDGLEKMGYSFGVLTQDTPTARFLSP